jgi:SAM-dependent methyltransferase
VRCYALRRIQLEHVLARRRHRARRAAGARRRLAALASSPSSNLEHGAHVTGLDITEASIERLRERFPQAEFVRADVSDEPPAGTYDVVNAFDVLYHITDDARWSRAVRNLAKAVAPGGIFLITDVFDRADGLRRAQRGASSLGIPIGAGKRRPRGGRADPDARAAQTATSACGGRQSVAVAALRHRPARCSRSG